MTVTQARLPSAAKCVGNLGLPDSVSVAVAARHWTDVVACRVRGDGILLSICGATDRGIWSGFSSRPDQARAIYLGPDQPREAEPQVGGLAEWPMATVLKT